MSLQHLELEVSFASFSFEFAPLSDPISVFFSTLILSSQVLEVPLVGFTAVKAQVLSPSPSIKIQKASRSANVIPVFLSTSQFHAFQLQHQTTPSPSTLPINLQAISLRLLWSIPTARRVVLETQAKLLVMLRHPHQDIIRMPIQMEAALETEDLQILHQLQSLDIKMRLIYIYNLFRVLLWPPLLPYRTLLPIVGSLQLIGAETGLWDRLYEGHLVDL